MGTVANSEVQALESKIYPESITSCSLMTVAQMLNYLPDKKPVVAFERQALHLLGYQTLLFDLWCLVLRKNKISQNIATLSDIGSMLR